MVTCSLRSVDKGRDDKTAITQFKNVKNGMEFGGTLQKKKKKRKEEKRKLQILNMPVSCAG